MVKLLLTILVAGAVGLKIIQDEIIDDEKPMEMLPVVDAEENKAVVQKLKSDEGMAYYGKLLVGGQAQVSIYDTGSFDVVIESKCLSSEKDAKLFVQAKSKNGTIGKVAVPACCSNSKCPYAQYSTTVSGSSFEANTDKQIEQITYGSGPVLVKAGWDHVSLKDETNLKTKGNTIAQAKVPVKIIVDHDIELFKETSMTAIIGVGPGHFDEKEKRLVSHLGIKRFMVCFQENAKADGFWTWNDKDRSGHAEWKVVPVTGKMFWAVATSNFMLDDTKLGCNPSCGGIIDTGTSLLTPPPEVIENLKTKLEKGDIEDCSDLSKFPDFHFDLGQDVSGSNKHPKVPMSLPPSSYIAKAGPQQTEVFHQHLAFAPLPLTKTDLAVVKAAKARGEAAPSVNACVLLLSPGDESEQTQFGPMVIFGMSLFRKYAAQFDLAGDHDGKENQRFMRFAEANSDCSGTKKGGEFRRVHSVMQEVNLDKLRVSPLQQSLAATRNYGSNLFRKGTLRI